MFIDTNVLVYARVLEAPNHDVARELLAQAMTGDERRSSADRCCASTSP